MNQPSPAIVAQNAVQRLPRWALLLLCLAYVVPGFVGRAPWRSTDMAAFGIMRELALGHTDWMAPLLAGRPPDTEGLLPYWLGAWSMQAFDSLLGIELAARLPFAALLALTLAATWYGAYYLARSPLAQPVAFAFGGEARPVDYARTLADAALLALVACLGLAQPSHETTSHLVQLACTSFLFAAAAAMPWRLMWPMAAAAAGLAGLVLSGAPALAMLLGLGSAVLVWFSSAGATLPRRAQASGWLLAVVAACALLAQALDLWGWRIIGWQDAKSWQSLARLFTWYLWPVWPLALWTVWRWRRQIASRQWHRHLLLPLWFAGVAIGATLTTWPADRALLLSLPAMATLAAFALPTLRRGIASLIDWFTLLFFSISAIAIWVVWLAVQTGFPAKPAANVARLAPGYVNHFALLPLLVALAATVAWCALVRWRAVRQRTVLWKSLVLPAGGTTLAWLLMMTLWLPLLDYGRSFVPQIAAVRQAMAQAALPTPATPPQGGGAAMAATGDCVIGYGLSLAQTAALVYHGNMRMATPLDAGTCQWVIADGDAHPRVTQALPAPQWELVASVPRPTARDDLLLVLRRARALDPQDAHTR